MPGDLPFRPIKLNGKQPRNFPREIANAQQASQYLVIHASKPHQFHWQTADIALQALSDSGSFEHARTAVLNAVVTDGYADGDQ